MIPGLRGSFGGKNAELRHENERELAKIPGTLASYL